MGTTYYWPVRGLRPGEGISNPYGGTQYRAPGFQGALPSKNVGVDIALGKANAPVIAPADCVVEQVLTVNGQHYGYGNSILVRTPSGDKFRLSHLADVPTVKVGQKLKAGVQIGRVGATGNTTDGQGNPAPHLDFEYHPAKGGGEGGTADPMTLRWASSDPGVRLQQAGERVVSGLKNVPAAVGKYTALILDAAKKTGVPAALLAATMKLESGGNPNARSAAGATGLMQVMPREAGPQFAGRPSAGELLNPATNISWGAKILADNFSRWGTWDKAVAAYLGTINGKGEITGKDPYTGMSGNEYVSRIMADANSFTDGTSSYGAGDPPAEPEDTSWTTGPYAAQIKNFAKEVAQAEAAKKLAISNRNTAQSRLAALPRDPKNGVVLDVEAASRYEAEIEAAAATVANADKLISDRKAAIAEMLDATKAEAGAGDQVQREIDLEVAKLDLEQRKVDVVRARQELERETDPIARKARELDLRQMEQAVRDADQAYQQADLAFKADQRAADQTYRRGEQEIDQSGALFPGELVSQELTNTQAQQAIDREREMLPRDVTMADLSNDYQRSRNQRETNEAPVDLDVKKTGLARDQWELGRDQAREPLTIEGLRLGNEQTAATTASIVGQEGREQELHPGALRQQDATYDNTVAGTEDTRSTTRRRDTLLPGEVAQQGADYDYTTAQTSRTRAETPTTLDVEARQRKALADALAAEYDNAMNSRISAINDLVATGAVTEADGMRMLGQFDKLLTAQITQRHNEQSTAQAAMDSHARLGVNSDPFNAHMIQATAPTVGLEQASKNFGYQMSDPVVRGVQAAMARVGDMAFGKSPNAGAAVAGLPQLPKPEDRSAEIRAQAAAATAPRPPTSFTPQAYAGSAAGSQIANNAPGQAAPAAPAAAPAPAAPKPIPYQEVAEDLGDGMAQNYYTGPGGYKVKNGDPYRIGGGGRLPAAYR